MTNKLTKLIKEQREEFKGTVWHARLKEFDRTTFDTEEQDCPTEMFIGLLEINTTALLEEVMKVVDEHDPNVKMGRKTGSTYWGNTLRHSLQETLDSINKHDKH